MDEFTNKDMAIFFSKMSRITGAIGNLKKDATNSFHKYSYVSSDAVLSTLAPLMAAENIALISETLEVAIDDKVYMPKYLFTFVCGDTGYMHSCVWFGETVHTSNKGTRDDKALNKAATISQKYFLLKTFLIATGDDPDGDDNRRNQPPRKTQEPRKAQQPTATGWAKSKPDVSPVIETFTNGGLTHKEIYQLAGVSNWNDWQGWNRFEDTKQAIKHMSDALEHLMMEDSSEAAGNNNSEGDTPAVYTCKFTHKAYEVAGKKCVKFANCNPSKVADDSQVIIAKAYGRSTEFRTMVGDYAYGLLGLADYDGATKTQPFSPIDIEGGIELEYVEKVVQKGKYKGETYKEIIGIVGGDSF